MVVGRSCRVSEMFCEMGGCWGPLYSDGGDRAEKEKLSLAWSSERDGMEAACGDAAFARSKGPSSQKQWGGKGGSARGRCDCCFVTRGEHSIASLK